MKNWMIRMDTDGKSHEGFQWNPINEWTEAFDWNERPECGGGLHGQNESAWGYVNIGNRLCLCEVEKFVKIDNEKGKAKRAMIVAINENIPAKYLEYTSISLIKDATLNLPQAKKIGGDIHMEKGGTLHLPQSKKIGGYIWVEENATLNLPQAEEIYGDIWVGEGATLHLPQVRKIGGNLRVGYGGTLHLPQVEVKIGGNLRVGDGATLHWK